LPHIPEAVSGSEESYYGVAATEIIPVLVGAVKELKAKVEALEAQVETLQTQVAIG
jgi:outer membrane murein-binding lipoprotein Lpp